MNDTNALLDILGTLQDRNNMTRYSADSDIPRVVWSPQNKNNIRFLLHGLDFLILSILGYLR